MQLKNELPRRRAARYPCGRVLSADVSSPQSGKVFMFRNKKFILIGFLAGLVLLFLYFLILSLANSFSHAVSQFSEMWYWILLLAAGFGTQTGFYFYIRRALRERQMKAPTGVVAASGGISTGSMVVCCLHHLVDVLPLMGLAAAALFLTQYQVLFIVIGIFSNLIGITLMLEIIQKNNLPQCSFLKKILIYDVSRVKKIAVGVSLVALLITFFLINISKKSNTASAVETNGPLAAQIEKKSESEKSINLPTKKSEQNGISFEVTPLDFNFENPVKFEIKIDTHSGSLDFDLIKISTIEDDKNNKYQPLGWQGPGPGGHHLSGILLFPKLDDRPKKIKLFIQGRVFEWSLDND